MFFSLAGCPKKEPKIAGQKSSDPKGGPAWVGRCAGAFPDSSKRAFYGCGAAAGINNEPFEIASADERSRVDLAKNIDYFVASFLTDFMASPSIKPKAKLEESERKQFISDLTRHVTETTLYGSQVLDRWRSPDGTRYALSKVSFESMEENLRRLMAECAPSINLDPEWDIDELNRQMEIKRSD